MGAAAGHHPVVQVLHLSGCGAAWNGQRDEQVFRGAPHGGDVTEVGGRGPKPDVGKRGGPAVEMNALRKEIGRQQQPALAVRGDDGGIVADPLDNPTINCAVASLESTDEVEFSDARAGLKPGRRWHANAAGDRPKSEKTLRERSVRPASIFRPGTLVSTIPAGPAVVPPFSSWMLCAVRPLSSHRPWYRQRRAGCP